MRVETFLSIFVLIFISVLGDSEQSSFEDERCVCGCPRSLCPNGTGPIFIKMIPPNDCRCEEVVPQVQSSESEHLCQFCTCHHENRNTTTIKVVVIFIICVVALLFIYMLFLMCLDPLIQHRGPSYIQQVDDDVTMDDMASIQSRPTGEASRRAAAGAIARQNSLLNRVSSEQQKWKGTVEEQRRNIYYSHRMLN